MTKKYNPNDPKCKLTPKALEEALVEKQLKNTRTLKRKIQNAMFRSTLLSQILLAAILIPGILNLMIPVGQYLTRGMAVEIINRYERNDTASSTAIKKPLANTIMLEKYTESQLAQDIVKMNQNAPEEISDNEVLRLLSTDLNETLTLFVIPESNDVKRLMVITSDQYKMSSDYFKKLLPFITLYNIQFNVHGNSFHLPVKEQMINGAYQKSIDAFVAQTERVIEVYDPTGTPYGSITIGINSDIISLMIIPYVLVIIGVSLVSLFIVSLLGKFMTYGILKPVNELNRQLKAMANDDIENLHQAQISVKRPPKEILQLTIYANAILYKMNEDRHLLEAQNEELHSQNDELVNTKDVIQNQQNQLVQSEKMASVGQLSAAIIHEINTPMGAVKSNSQMIHMLIEKSKAETENTPVFGNLVKIQALTDITLQAADRITNIVRSLKNYSRLDQSEFKETDINDDIRSVVLLTSNLWKNRVHIVEDMAELPPVKCYSGLLNQVFMNLIVNAIDAMPVSGTLTLHTRVEGDNVVFESRDTGTGISPEHLSRIFDEGFTTKPKDSGSGLGLALSNAVVEKHNGKIEVETEVGVGSTFRVIIPISPDMT